MDAGGPKTTGLFRVRKKPCVLARPGTRQGRARLQRSRAGDGGKSWFTGKSTEDTVKPLRREGSGLKMLTKSIAKIASVLHCVAIRCGRDFSTIYPWKRADARLGRPVSLVAGLGKRTSGGALRTIGPRMGPYPKLWNRAKYACPHRLCGGLAGACRYAHRCGLRGEAASARLGGVERPDA